MLLPTTTSQKEAYDDDDDDDSGENDNETMAHDDGRENRQVDNGISGLLFSNEQWQWWYGKSDVAATKKQAPSHCCLPASREGGMAVCGCGCGCNVLLSFPHL